MGINQPKIAKIMSQKLLKISGNISQSLRKKQTTDIWNDTTRAVVARMDKDESKQESNITKKVKLWETVASQ
jgi:hypothetical protein